MYRERIFSCIDKLYVWLWPDGTLKTGKSARKIEVQKSQTSVIVEVEACIGYRSVKPVLLYHK